MHQAISSLIFVSLMFGAAACTVGPDYSPPGHVVAGDWVSLAGASAHGQVSDQTGDLSRWWKTFDDRDLDLLMDRAVEANLDLALAESRIREARAARGVAAADFAPQVEASAGAQRSRRSENAGNTAPNRSDPTVNLFQIGFDAAWELDIFGGTRRAVEASRADIEVAIENRRDAVVTLLAEVGRNYIELRTAQQRIVIAERNVAAQADTFSLANSRARAGINSDLDAAQASALLSSTQASIPALQAQARQAMYRLGVLLGQDPGMLVDQLSPTGHLPETSESVPAGLPSELLRRRPDIRAAERSIAAATARVGVATADLYPRFTILADLGLQSEAANSLIDAPSRYWTMSPGIRWPILDGSRIRSNILVQTEREEQALIGYERTILHALADVETAITAYINEHERRDFLAASLEASRRAVELAVSQYSSGLTAFLAVLDAQRTLFQAEDMLLQSESRLAENLIALYKALGGGWETFDCLASTPIP